MIAKNKNKTCWLEFDILQEFDRLSHAVFLKDHTPPQILIPNQLHGNKIVRVSSQTEPTPNCDALSTSAIGISLGVTHADCQAAILYDPVKHAVACIHSGWRGSVLNIYKRAIIHMEQQYRSNPKDLFLCIGPSLGPESAEFIHHKEELPSPFWEYQITPNHFDFWEVSKDQAIECGLTPDHIEIARLDTKEGDFYSFRRDKTSKRHITTAKLR